MSKEDDYKNALEDMIDQFAVALDNPPRITTGGLGALEHAFQVLGYSDPMPAPERGCQMDDCQRVATCGTKTEDGYKWVCLTHWKEINP